MEREPEEVKLAVATCQLAMGSIESGLCATSPPTPPHPVVLPRHATPATRVTGDGRQAAAVNTVLRESLAQTTMSAKSQDDPTIKLCCLETVPSARARSSEG